MTQKLKEWLSERTITEVECLVPDIAGIPRGKILPAEKYHKVLQGSGLRLPEYVFGQTVTGDYHDSIVLNAAVGDIVLKPDEKAAYLVPWYSEPTAQIIHDAYYLNDTEVTVAPRSVLKRVIRKLSDKGLSAIVAPELEFFLFSQCSDPDYPL